MNVKILDIELIVHGSAIASNNTMETCCFDPCIVLNEEL